MENYTDNIIREAYDRFIKEFNSITKDKIQIDFSQEEINNQNPIVKLLSYYRVVKLMKMIGIQDRKKYDGDVIAFQKYKEKEVLNADVAISFWSLYSRMTKLKETGKEDSGGYQKNYKRISQMINDFNNIELDKEVKENFEFLASNYWSRGNLLKLPERGMNLKRYQLYEDRIDSTLFNCFEGGSLSEYFKNDDQVNEWIKSEHLECLCDNDELYKKENGKIVNFGVKSDVKIRELSEDQLKEYLNFAKKIIEYRNSMFD